METNDSQITISEDKPKHKCVSIPTRNMFFLGSTYCLIFICYYGTKIFATSLNQGLGYISLGVLYAVFAVSNFFTPIIFAKFGYKPCFIAGGLTYAAWIGCNIKVNEYAIIVVSAVTGVGSSLLTVTQGSFMTKNSTRETIVYLSSIYLTLFQLSNIFSYMLTGILLYIQFSFDHIFIVFLVVAAVVPFGFMFLNLKYMNTKVEVMPVSARIRQTFKKLQDKRILLLIPTFVYVGIADSWITGIFPPLMNVNMISFVMLCYGGMNCAWVFTLGRIANRITTRTVLIIAGCSMLIGLVLTWLVYDTFTNLTWLFYVSASFYGLADGGFKSQIYKVIKVIFPENNESEIGVCRFFQYSFVAITFFVSRYIPILYMIIIIGVLVISSIITYIILERFVSKE